ncbi:MAG: hypothetical protein AB4372_01560 [Xenococcus sp. (in: cyanobacteria)]
MPISAGQRTHDIAYPGQVLSGQHRTFTKGTYEGITNGESGYLPFGRFIVDKTGGEVGEIALPSATGQALRGVSVFADSEEKASDGTSGFPPKRPATFLFGGIIAVKAETAMVRGGAIYVRHTDAGSPGTFDACGRVRNDADSGNADLLPTTEGKVLFDCAAGDICRIELDISPLK